MYSDEACDPSDLSTCFDMSQEIDCPNYVHDMTQSDSFWSLASEYDWICDQNAKGSNVLAAQNIGIILTAVIFMQLSDTFGRSPVLHTTNFIYIILRLISLHITDNYWAFLVLIAAGSTFSPLGIRIGYTLGMIWLLFYEKIPYYLV